MKKLEDQLMAVVGDLRKVAQKIDKVTKRVENGCANLKLIRERGLC